VVSADPGTEYWSDDEEYATAVDVTTSNTLRAALTVQGVDIDGLEWEGEQRCPETVLPAYLEEFEASHGQ